MKFVSNIPARNSKENKRNAPQGLLNRFGSGTVRHAIGYARSSGPFNRGSV
jgi:hypothetical protein